MHIRQALGATPVAIFLALAIAGSAIAQSAVPAGPADPLAPAWFTGTIGLAPSCDQPMMTITDGVREERGYRCTPQTWTMSDPRLSGTGTWAWNTDVYILEDGVLSLSATNVEVTNDSGEWSCWLADGLARGTGVLPDGVNDETLTCEGAGAYDGLSAIVVVGADTVSGLIFPGEVPPIP